VEDQHTAYQHLVCFAALCLCTTACGKMLPSEDEMSNETSEANSHWANHHLYGGSQVQGGVGDIGGENQEAAYHGNVAAGTVVCEDQFVECVFEDYH